mmetsp:Transcript_2078/g.5587  ORF Transcript_2078/g.5587 Transcript_2078/m.5587 type:complete len:224 (+) Transcript_2078:226-897(+)
MEFPAAQPSPPGVSQTQDRGRQPADRASLRRASLGEAALRCLRGQGSDHRCSGIGPIFPVPVQLQAHRGLDRDWDHPRLLRRLHAPLGQHGLVHKVSCQEKRRALRLRSGHCRCYRRGMQAPDLHPAVRDLSAGAAKRRQADRAARHQRCPRVGRSGTSVHVQQHTGLRGHRKGAACNLRCHPRDALGLERPDLDDDFQGADRRFAVDGHRRGHCRLLGKSGP